MGRADWTGSKPVFSLIAGVVHGSPVAAWGRAVQDGDREWPTSAHISETAAENNVYTMWVKII